MSKAKPAYTIRKPDPRDTLEGAAVEERVLEYTRLRAKYACETHWGLLEIDPADLNQSVLPGQDLRGTNMVYYYSDPEEGYMGVFTELQGSTWFELWMCAEELVRLGTSRQQQVITSFTLEAKHGLTVHTTAVPSHLEL